MFPLLLTALNTDLNPKPETLHRDFNGDYTIIPVKGC